MTIKRSSLEQKWYYRLMKIIFLILPILIVLLLLLTKKKLMYCSITQVDLSSFWHDYFLIFLAGLILYYLLINVIWKGILYIVYGGIENDKTTKAANNNEIPELTLHKKTTFSSSVPYLILMAIILTVLLANAGIIKLPKIDPGFMGNLGETNTSPKSNSKCPATSAQTSTPCHSVQGGVGVFGVIVPSTCNCPSDTTFAGMDNITAGGPYKMCTCN